MAEHKGAVPLCALMSVNYNSVAKLRRFFLHVVLFCMLLCHSNTLHELPSLANNLRHLVCQISKAILLQIDQRQSLLKSRPHDRLLAL